jgi:hypothetical protein
MKGRIGCNTFRAIGVPAYLEGGGTLENAETMAAHESLRTIGRRTAKLTRTPCPRRTLTIHRRGGGWHCHKAW